jgi:hypothetical protein
MPHALRTLLLPVALVLSLPGAIRADDYPTKPDEMDKLCHSIGKEPDTATPPKDRLWYMENCLCIENVGCGFPGSATFAARVEAVRQKEATARQAEAEQQAAQDRVQAARRVEALKETQQACVPLTGCFQRQPGVPPNCEEAATRFEYDCSASLRDSEACGQAVKAAAGGDAAGCQAALH